MILFFIHLLFISPAFTVAPLDVVAPIRSKACKRFFFFNLMIQKKIKKKFREQIQKDNAFQKSILNFYTSSWCFIIDNLLEVARISVINNTTILKKTYLF